MTIDKDGNYNYEKFLEDSSDDYPKYADSVDGFNLTQLFGHLPSQMNNPDLEDPDKSKLQAKNRWIYRQISNNQKTKDNNEK